MQGWGKNLSRDSLLHTSSMGQVKARVSQLLFRSLENPRCFKGIKKGSFQLSTVVNLRPGCQEIFYTWLSQKLIENPKVEGDPVFCSWTMLGVIHQI